MSNKGRFERTRPCGGEGEWKALVTLLLWLNNGREEMFKMAARENGGKGNGVLESLLYTGERRGTFFL